MSIQYFPGEATHDVTLRTSLLTRRLNRAPHTLLRALPEQLFGTSLDHTILYSRSVQICPDLSRSGSRAGVECCSRGLFQMLSHVEGGGSQLLHRGHTAAQSTTPRAPRALPARSPRAPRALPARAYLPVLLVPPLDAAVWRGGCLSLLVSAG
jgi:hypothetical protein